MVLVAEVIGVTIATTVVVNTVGPYVVRSIRRFWRWLRYRNPVLVTKASDPMRFYQMSISLNAYRYNGVCCDTSSSILAFSLPRAPAAVSTDKSDETEVKTSEVKEITEDIKISLDMYAPGSWINLPKFPDITIEILGDDVNGVTGYSIWPHRWGVTGNTKLHAYHYLNCLGNIMSAEYRHITIPPTAMMQLAMTEQASIARLTRQVAQHSTQANQGYGKVSSVAR